MHIKILLNANPFSAASASANRWLTLIEGLDQLGVKIQIFVVGNFKSEKEKKVFALRPKHESIEINYLSTQVAENIWTRRFDKYIGRHFTFRKIKNKITTELLGFKGIVWCENDLDLWKIISSIPNKSFHLIAEMSEFLDIHQYNKGNALQRNLANVQQEYFENIYIKKLDGFILMTKTLMNHYQNFPDLNLNILHLPMTVDLERFKPQLPVPKGFEKPYIAFVGVMDDAKDGVSILIESFSQIHSEFPEYKLYLVGGWNYDTPKHQKLIKEYGLEQKIIWKGELPRNEIPAIIKNASILALPRPDSKQAQGGFPTKLGEYLATGNPVCATTVGEIPDYLVDGESVFFAEPGLVSSYVETLRKALHDPKSASEIGLKGCEVAEKYFNKDIQSKLLFEFLKEF